MADQTYSPTEARRQQRTGRPALVKNCFAVLASTQPPARLTFAKCPSYLARSAGVMSASTASGVCSAACSHHSSRCSSHGPSRRRSISNGVVGASGLIVRFFVGHTVCACRTQTRPCKVASISWNKPSRLHPSVLPSPLP